MNRVCAACFPLAVLALVVGTPGGGAAVAPRADADLLKLVGEIQVGSPRAVAADGATAYVGEDLRLVTLDLSVDPPARRGGTGLLAGNVSDMAVAGDIAVVAMGSAGLLLVDVADPARPVTTARVADAASRVMTADGRAYALGDALRVYDLADPAAPVLLGTIPASANDFTVVDGRAYLVTGKSGLRILDVANPAARAADGAGSTLGQDMVAAPEPGQRRTSELGSRQREVQRHARKRNAVRSGGTGAGGAGRASECHTAVRGTGPRTS